MISITNTASANVSTLSSQTCASCDGMATYNSSLIGMVDFQWFDENGTLVFSESNASGTSEANGLCPGIYNVQATNQSDNEFVWFNIDIPLASPGNFTTLTKCNTENVFDLFTELEGTPMPGGVWEAPDFTPINPNIDPETAIEGLYTYTINVNGCELKTGLLLSINQNANPGLSETYLICENYEPFDLDEQLDGADLGGTWFDPDQQEFEGLYDPASSTPGSYVYRIDTVPFCPAVFATLTILQNVLPNAGIDTDVFVCPGAVPVDLITELGGNPDLNGQWFDTNNQVFDGVFDPNSMPEGSYRYRILAAVPCPNQDSHLTLTFANGISSGTPNPIEICSQGQVVDLNSGLSNSPTIGGQWRDPNNNLVDPFINSFDLQTGNYSYTVSAIGCADEETLLPVLAELEVLAGADNQAELCETEQTLNINDLLDVNASPAGEWSIEGVVQLNPIIQLVPGNYDLTYEVQGTLCPNDIAVFELSVDPSPEPLSSINQWVCSADADVDLLGFFPPTSFNHFVLDQNQNEVTTYSPALGGFTGELIIESGNSCANQVESIIIHTEELQFASSNVDTLLCSTGEIVDAEGMFPDPIDWSISNWLNGSSDVVTSFEAEVDQSGAYTYTYEHPMACGSSQLNLSLQFILPPDAGMNQQTEVCINAPPMATSELNDLPNAIWLTSDFNPIGIVLPENGDQNLLMILEGVDLCPADTAIYTINVDQGVDLELNDLQVCSSLDPLEISVTSFPGYSYQWSSDFTLSSTNGFVTTLIPENLDISTENVLLDLNISNGICSFSENALIEIHPIPQIQVAGETELCINDQFELLAQGADSYSWTVNGVLSQGSMLSFEAQNTVQVQCLGTSDFGCEQEVLVDLTVHDLPDVNFDATPLEGCVPLDVQLINLSSNGAGTSYLWTIDGTDIAVFEPEPYTLFNPGLADVSLLAINEYGCSNWLFAEDYLNAFGFPIADFDFINSVISDVDPTLELLNLSDGESNWEWSIGNDLISDYSPIVELGYYADSGFEEVCLWVENEHGCADSVCKTIEFITKPNVYVPNAFTPDLDGINDTFFAHLTGIDPDQFEMQIFNRWGELIFESNDVQIPWQGEAKNEGDYFAPDGVYTWRIGVVDSYTKETLNFQGHVSLMR